MNLFERIYINLFTKWREIIITKDKFFEFKMPSGFRYRYTRGIYQVFDPSEKGFLFQWQGFVLPDITENHFDIDLELKNEIENNPNAEIQTTGNYDCICSSTITEDEKEIVYKWLIGEKNKRLLVTLLLDGQKPRKIIDGWIFRAGQLIKNLIIIHAA